MSDGDDLIDAHFAGELDAAGAARLGAWLLESRANRMRLLDEAAWRAELRAGLACDPESTAMRPGPRAARWRWAWPVAAAAAALIVFGAISAGLAASSTRPPAASVRIAEVTAPAHLVHGADRRAAAAGDLLPPGTRLVTGEGGSAQVSPSDGTLVRIGGHADLSWLGAEDGQRWRLDAGGIDADFAAQPAGKPARIRTTHATVQVVGTSFTLATDVAATRLCMREGVVDIESNDHRGSLTCRAGDRAIADAAGVRPDAPPAGPFSGFSLVDADADRPITEFDPIPDGTVVHLGALRARSITIAVRMSAGATPPASARLLVDGRLHRIERQPYSLMGNHFLDTARTVPDYKPWKPPLGRPVRIEAVPCSDAEGARPSGPAVTATYRFEK